MSLDRRQLLRRAAAAAGVAALPATLAETALAAGGGDFASHPPWSFALLSHLTTDPLFVALQYGADDAASLVGCSASWAGSATGDAKELSAAVASAVSAKADGIAVSVPDVRALDGALGRALAARIPVITLNVDVGHVAGGRRLAYVGLDHVTTGRALGARIGALVGKGPVALFVGGQARPGLQPLIDAATAAIRAAAPKVTPRVVPTGDDVYTQLGAVGDYANAHKDVRGLFALDTGSTEGLGIALGQLHLRAAGVKTGGWGVLPAAIKLIGDGHLDFTVDEQPYQQGFAAVLQLFLTRMSGGLLSPGEVVTRPIFVTRGNMKLYAQTRTRFEGSSSRQKYPITS